MKILLSPAKSINQTTKLDYPLVSSPVFSDEAEQLVRKLKRLKSGDLMSLMHISEDLADQNKQRYESWQRSDIITEDIQPCSFMFNGEVYKALQVHSLNDKELLTAQDRIRILSGLYGILKPLDLIYPYRLEMGTKWSPDSKSNSLYSFWKEKVTKHLLSTLEKDEMIINLASSEYAKAIDWKKVTNPIVTPVFKEFKNGALKIVMMYAKHARGAMAKYLVQHEVTDVEQLKLYNADGYAFDDRSSNEKEWVFIR